jgi:hypothetical protein
VNISAILICATVTVFAFAAGEAISEPLSKVIKFCAYAAVLAVAIPIALCWFVFMSPYYIPLAIIVQWKRHQERKAANA